MNPVMGSAKAILKNLFYKTGTVSLLDRVLFNIARLKYKANNTRFKKEHPDVAIPPDYYLYETYFLSYADYVNDGIVTAREIVEWAGSYFTNEPGQVLEWGCGVSRVVRHLPGLYSSNTSVYACDINSEMIAWNTNNITNVYFNTIRFLPPIGYGNNFFNLVYAISVFTHIDVEQQENWLKEIHRILATGGVFIFTTHGNYFTGQLLQHEKQALMNTGMFTKAYGKKGHRMMTSYNVANRFADVVKKYFDVLEFWDGAENISKIGGQDLWIVRKSIGN